MDSKKSSIDCTHRAQVWMDIEDLFNSVFVIFKKSSFKKNSPGLRRYNYLISFKRVSQTKIEQRNSKTFKSIN